MKTSSHLFFSFFFIFFLSSAAYSQSQDYRSYAMDQLIYYDSLMRVCGDSCLDTTDFKHFMRKWEYYRDDIMNSATGTLEEIFDYEQQMYADLSLYYSTYQSTNYNPYWKELGPLKRPEKHLVNTTAGIGRLSCIEVDPLDEDQILVGSPTGGLFYSDNGAATFVSAGTDQLGSVIGVSDAEIVHHNNTTYWVIATGDRDNDFNYSAGVYMSEDFGATWTHKSNGLQSAPPNGYYRIHKLIVDPTNPLIAYIATSVGIYKTSSLLSSSTIWTLVQSGNYFDIEFKPGNSSTIYASANLNQFQGYSPGINAIIVSTNWGNTWNEVDELPTPLNVIPPNQNNFIRISIETVVDNPDVLYALICCYGDPDGINPKVDIDFLFKYDDLAPMNAKWQQKDMEDQNGNRLDLTYGRQGFEASNQNENIIVVSNIDPYYSVDGGNTFYRQPNMHPDIHDILFRNNEPTAWFATDGGLYEYTMAANSSPPGGGDRSPGLGVAIFMALDVHPSSKYLLAGGWDTGANLYTLSNNITVNPWKGITGGDTRGMAFNANDWNICYTSAVGYIQEFNIATEVINNITPPVAMANGNIGMPFWDSELHFCPDNNILLNTNYPTVFTSGNTESCLWRKPSSSANWHDITTNKILEPDYFIYSVFVSPSNSEYVYLRLVNPFTHNAPDLVYKTTNISASNPTWTKVTTNNIPGAPGYISDIAVDPSNPDAFWITFASYNNPAAKVLYFDGSQYINHTGSLSQLNPSVYQVIPHNNGVILGTSAGIFVKHNASTTWDSYNGSFPYVRPVEMIKNEQSNKLYVATFGRGVWEVGLPCIVDPNPVTTTIGTNTTYSSDMYFSGDIRIHTGNTLTIDNEATIMMDAGTKIVVEPGARLIIDNATLNSSCGDYWSGIEVWGENTMPQTLLPSGMPEFQGMVVIRNGGTIKNSVDGIMAMAKDANGDFIWNKAGGIIIAKDAFFINNNNSIWIGAYEYVDVTGLKKPNRSKIIDCEFEWNDLMLVGHTGFSFVGLLDVDNIQLIGNSFINNKSIYYATQRGTAIYSYDASFNMDHHCVSTQVNPCAEYRTNTFQGLHYGIKVYNTDNNAVVQVKHADFINCYRSMFLNNTHSAVITSNSIELPQQNISSAGPPYGIYFNGGRGFKVEENDISANSASTTRGIIVHATGSVDNQLYKNNLNGLAYGIQAQKQNRESTDHYSALGLRFFCNTHSNPDTHDFIVLGHSIFAPRKGDGVATAQLFSTTDPSLPDYLPAGNTFTSRTNPGTTYNDFDNSDVSNILDYYYWDDAAAPEQRPTDFWNIILNDMDDENTCPSTININNDLSHQYAQRSAAEAAWNSSSLILDIWKNGGNLNLEEEVETTLPWDVYQEFNELMGISPYLEEEVLIATIENPAFTSLMIKLLMIANPHACRSDMVLDAIYNRTPPLPQSYIDEILDEESSASQLDMLRDDAASDYHLLKMTDETIKRIYRCDTTNIWASDSLLEYISRQGDLFDQYDLAGLFLSSGLYAEMDTILSDIPVAFELASQDLGDYYKLLEMHSIASNAFMAGTLPVPLDSVQIDSLECYINEDIPYLSSFSLSLLMRHKPDYIFEELILDPVPGSTRTGRPVLEREDKESQFQLYPNPAGNYVTVSYIVEEYEPQLELCIIDSHGKVIRTMMLSESAGEIMLDLQGIPAGFYLFRLTNKNKTIGVEKLHILK